MKITDKLYDTVRIHTSPEAAKVIAATVIVTAVAAVTAAAVAGVAAIGSKLGESEDS